MCSFYKLLPTGRAGPASALWRCHLGAKVMEFAQWSRIEGYSPPGGVFTAADQNKEQDG